MFLCEAISYLQRDFDRKRGGYIDKKEVIAEIHKEIFSESDTKPFTQNQTSQIVVQKSNKKNSRKKKYNKRRKFY